MKFIHLFNLICNVLMKTEQEDLKLFKSFSESEILSIYYSNVRDCFSFVFKTGQMLIKANLESGEIGVKSFFGKADSDRKGMKLIEFVSLVCSLLATIEKEDLPFFNALSESEIRWIAYSEERNGFFFSFAKGNMHVVVDPESLTVRYGSDIEVEDKDKESEDVIH